MMGFEHYYIATLERDCIYFRGGKLWRADET